MREEDIYRDPRRAEWLPTCLAVGWLIVAVGLGSVDAARFPHTHMLGGLVLVAIHAQISMLIGWITIGQYGRTVTAVILTLAASCLLLIPNTNINDVLKLAAMVAVLDLPLIALRLGGWRIALVESSSDWRNLRLQFSIRDLISLSVVTALVAVVWRNWLGEPHTDNGWDKFGRTLAVLVVAALGLPVAGWVGVFLFRPLYAWLIGAPLLLVSVFIAAGYVEASDAGSTRAWLALHLLVWQAVFLGHFTALYVAGYRWQWRKPAWFERLQRSYYVT
jgi:hypothetical protein